MNNFFKKTLIFTILVFLLTGCQTLREGLEGSKKGRSAEEFLIDKKNPLVLPPDYSKLPVPKDDEEQTKSKNEIDVEQILKKNPQTSNTYTNKKGSSLEKSILEKIKD